jgi:hypothetical protein
LNHENFGKFVHEQVRRVSAVPRNHQLGKLILNYFSGGWIHFRVVMVNKAGLRSLETRDASVETVQEVTAHVIHVSRITTTNAIKR